MRSAIDAGRATLLTTFKSPLGVLKDQVRRAVKQFLNGQLAAYELKVPNDMPGVYREIQKGDVVLVEGGLRVSQLVKYVTQSQWSHCALYVGDELLRRDGQLREQAKTDFGQFADRLIVEALIEGGVMAAPLEKYRSHNIRICRPLGIGPSDLVRVVDSIVGDLGKQYDEHNLLDLALILTSPVMFGLLKSRTVETCLGNCTDRQVICSGMIAKAFQQVGYPVLPHFDGLASRAETRVDVDPCSSRRTMRHYSQILPRDFDLSPNFQVIKVDCRCK